jgi:hypothetical protein
MLTFREFYQICEGKKPDTPPHAVPGTYKRDADGTQTYTLQRYEGPLGKPTKKEVQKLVVDRSGGKAVKKRLKKLAKSVNKIEEDIEQRRQELRQRSREQMQKFKEKSRTYADAQRQRAAEDEDRKRLKDEIKRELGDEK